MVRLPRGDRFSMGLLALAVIVIACLAPLSANAQSTVPISPYIVELGPQARLEVPVYGFCLDPARPFPDATLELVGLAADPVRLAAAYSLYKGYVSTEPLQTQLAIWYFATGGTRVPDKPYGPVAEEIIAFVEAGGSPPDLAGGATALHNAVTAGYAAAVVENFVKIGPEEEPGYFGQGVLVITSQVDFTQQILVPYGLRFRSPTSEETQEVGIFPQTLPKPRPTPTPPATPPVLPPTGQLLPTPALIALAALVSGGALAGLRRYLARR